MRTRARGRAAACAVLFNEDEVSSIPLVSLTYRLRFFSVLHDVQLPPLPASLAQACSILEQTVHKTDIATKMAALGQRSPNAQRGVASE